MKKLREREERRQKKANKAKITPKYKSVYENEKVFLKVKSV